MDNGKWKATASQLRIENYTPFRRLSPNGDLSINIEFLS